MPLTCRLSLCLMLFLALNIQAQTNFIKGTITDNSYDSIEGLIDYRSWETNPKSISFKKNLNAQKVIFSPTDIKSFMVGGDLYETHKIKFEGGIETTAAEDGSYVSSGTPNDTLIFMRCHIKGYWNLYSHSISNGQSSLYINQGNDTLCLLSYKKILAVNTGGLRFGMREGYKRQLMKYFYDYQDLSKKIQKASYTIATIQPIVAEYNAHFASKVPITFIETSRKNSFQLHLLAGVNNSYLAIATLSNILTSPRIPDQTITGRGFDFGVSAQWFSSRRINKLSFVADLEIKTMQLFKDFNDLGTTSQTTFNNSYLRLYTQGRYQVLRSKPVSISANAGIFMSYALKKDNTYTTVYSGNLKNSGSLFPEDDFKQFTTGLTAGLICQLKSFALEIRGETNRGMSPYNTISSRLSSLNAFLYYRLY